MSQLVNRCSEGRDQRSPPAIRLLLSTEIRQMKKRVFLRFHPRHLDFLFLPRQRLCFLGPAMLVQFFSLLRRAVALKRSQDERHQRA